RELPQPRGKSRAAERLNRRDSLHPPVQQARPDEYRTNQLSRVSFEQSRTTGAKLRSHLEHGPECFRVAQRELANATAQIQQERRRSHNRCAASGCGSSGARAEDRRSRHHMNNTPALTIENVASLDGILA